MRQSIPLHTGATMMRSPICVAMLVAFGLAHPVSAQGTGGPKLRIIETNGIKMRIAERGQGPLILLLHVWPESWYSWRHQFGPLAVAGYRVVAPDQRGYARSEQPPDVTSYTLLHLVGDVITLIEELGEEQAVVVGHDWGAPVAWIAAMLRPDKVRAVAGLSVPPILPGGMVPPSITRTQYGEGFYQIYFQQPGVADAEFAKDIPDSFRRILVGASGDNPLGREPRPLVIPDGLGLLDTMPESPALPAWLTEEDIQAYAEDYALHGEQAFTGAFNWYRNIERNNELLAPFRGDRKSTRLNSSHITISYAVFCWKKKKMQREDSRSQNNQQNSNINSVT